MIMDATRKLKLVRKILDGGLSERLNAKEKIWDRGLYIGRSKMTASEKRSWDSAKNSFPEKYYIQGMDINSPNDLDEWQEAKRKEPGRLGPPAGSERAVLERLETYMRKKVPDVFR